MTPQSREEAKLWLIRAEADLRAAELDLSTGDALLEDTLFHCQQAVEKSLKALITAHGGVFRKTHDLDELADLCVQIDPDVKQIFEPVRGLTPYATIFRYPGEWETPKREQAINLLAAARSSYNAVVERLGCG